MSDYDFCPSCNQYGCHLNTCPHIQGIMEEYHSLLNEPMYAGTRKDWIWRAQKAEADVERLKTAHSAELDRLLKRLVLMEDLVAKRLVDDRRTIHPMEGYTNGWPNR